MKRNNLTRTGIALILMVTLYSTLCSCASYPKPELGVPETSASKVTIPPSNMTDIDTHRDMFGAMADIEMITLGPFFGLGSSVREYKGKVSQEFELGYGEPVLAPVDMTLVGFSNRSAEYRIQNGVKNAPYDDLMLCFESASPDWPNMVIVVYHLATSPLLIGHTTDPECTACQEWGEVTQAQGHLYFEAKERIISKNDTAASCEALIGYTVKRGELIGYAGSVGDHSMASFCFKVQNMEKNRTAENGNPWLHWVQPATFFYWMCYAPDAIFEPGVLAYPFVCDDYRLPEEQRSFSFKYRSDGND